MLEKMKYINHLNEVLEFGQNGIFANYSDVHDYEWNHTENNNRISSFNKGIIQKTIPVTICCSSVAEGLSAKNRLMEICEKDVLAMSHGKLVVGDYYLKCFVAGSEKTRYLVSKNTMDVSLTVLTDFPKWVKETTFSFLPDSRSESGSGKNLDFPFDFPFDYSSLTRTKVLNNTGFVGTNFRMVIYGEVVNPTIYVGGHKYCVECTVQAGEYLTINSLEKKIFLTKNDGTQVNQFNNRSRDSYIFETIPAGEHSVSWNGGFGFDIVLLEERSEPKWT